MPRRLSMLCVLLLASVPAAQDTLTIAKEGKPLSFRVKLLVVDTNEGCDVGDVNKDGVLDIVAGRFWFAGPDYTPRPLRAIAEFGKDYSATNGEFLYDVNGDGLDDVYVCQPGGLPNRLLLQQPDGTAKDAAERAVRRWYEQNDPAGLTGSL